MLCKENSDARISSSQTCIISIENSDDSISRSQT